MADNVQKTDPAAAMSKRQWETVEWLPLAIIGGLFFIAGVLVVVSILRRLF